MNARHVQMSHARDDGRVLAGLASADEVYMKRVLRLERLSWRGRQLVIGASVAGYTFTTSVWYHDVDLDALATRLGEEVMERLALHIALFEINRLVSLRPDVLELGRWSVYCTEELEALWRAVYRGVWGQWRYEQDDPGYDGPALATPPAGRSSGPLVTLEAGPVEALVCCGGGKDSLVALGLMEDAGERYATMSYAHAVYGAAGPQHALIDGLLDGRARRAGHTARHRITVLDDFMSAPHEVFAPALGVRTILAAETPASLFLAAPILLTHGLREVVMAHERSANVGNLEWRGEEINHQWGKSLMAERLLDAYLGAHLLGGARYYSLLQPLHDATIFALLADAPDGVARAHSCNIAKPWCERCAKCAYVWISYMAYLPHDLITPLFKTNLLDTTENMLWWRQLLGLETHTPFECVGLVEEARLAFALARARGVQGEAMRMFEREVGEVDVATSGERLWRVYEDEARWPKRLSEPLLKRMRRVAEATRQRHGIIT
jgi:UDP-N-acetyl-alpha-D-muramoyl-L-alanyl-L-glutamate epimerase